jgi:hypothetical protein
VNIERRKDKQINQERKEEMEEGKVMTRKVNRVRKRINKLSKKRQAGSKIRV